MRHLLTLAAGLSLLGLVTGCHPIIVGICDCDIPGHQCCYGCVAYSQLQPAYLSHPMAPPLAAPAVMPGEDVKKMPREAGKEAAPAPAPAPAPEPKAKPGEAKDKTEPKGDTDKPQ